MPITPSRFVTRICFSLFVLLLLPVLAHGAARTYTVDSPDGTRISVQEAGNAQGQPIIFIHGLLGSHLSWEKQISSPELQRYRLITFDMRGHGMSDKPDQAEAYRDGRRWADDLSAVIAGSGAQQPVLVGWSLGAAVITNYLSAYTDAQIAGALYVGGVIELKQDQLVAQPQVYEAMASSDLRTHLDGERRFVALCFATPPDDTMLQRTTAIAAMASGTMQGAVPEMTIASTEGLGSMHKPLLLIYGERDSLVQPDASTARAKALYPRATMKLYPTSGHSPFFEEAARFNRDLSSFVEAAKGPLTAVSQGM